MSKALATDIRVNVWTLDERGEYKDTILLEDVYFPEVWSRIEDLGVSIYTHVNIDRNVLSLHLGYYRDGKAALSHVIETLSSQYTDNPW